MNLLWTSVVAFSLSMSAFASPGHDMKVEMPKTWEKLKPWIGTWEGTTQSGKEEQKVQIVYEMTSGGTAMIERLSPGTAHEMISIYHSNGKEIAMTHYCMLGNHPEMTLNKVDGSTLTFELSKKHGLKSEKEPHMHSVVITMTDNDHMKADWALWENGKAKGVSSFTLTRKK